MEPGCLQFCPVPGLEEHWNTRGSIWTPVSIAVLCRWQRTGTDCPERLWNLLNGDLQKPPWYGTDVPAWAGVGRDGLKVLPTSTILWFCYSLMKGNKLHGRGLTLGFLRPLLPIAAFLRVDLQRVLENYPGWSLVCYRSTLTGKRFCEDWTII